MPALTAAQRLAIAHPASRLQVLACAGSGKTEVLARRAVRLLVEGGDPAALIAFTFTEKAAAELKARIESRAAEADARFRELPPVGRGMFIGTTHAWALGALRQVGGEYEMLDGLTDEQEWALLYRLARRLGVVDLYAGLEERGSQQVATAPGIDAFLRSVEVVHNERIDRTRLQQEVPAFAGVLKRYEQVLREMRLVPFRLMIAYAIDELQPGGRLREQLENRVSHVLVDEFQDFNPAQDLLLQLLGGIGATVTAVADDDQAIYQWRGGDVSLFVHFGQRFPGTQQVPLAENHRSRPEIVEVARHLLTPLTDRLPKMLISSRSASSTGAVELMTAQTAELEAEAAARRIRALVDHGQRPGDIAVLYRSVRTSAPPLFEALRAQDLPFVVVGKTSMLAHPEVALLVRVFVWWAGGTWYPGEDFQPEVVTPESIAAQIKALLVVTDRQAEKSVTVLEKIGDRIRAGGIADSVLLLNEMLVTLGLPGNGDQAHVRERRLGRLSELLTDFDHSMRRAVPERFYREQFGARAEEAAEDVALSPDGRIDEGAGGLAESGAVETAERSRLIVDRTPGDIYLLRLRAFLEQFVSRAAEETPDTVVESENAVQVMTVHQAKGLEFPVVFVPALVEGRFPTRLMGRRQDWYVPDAFFDRKRYEGREDDEARLLYVALTRAKELLVISWFDRHQVNRARPSRFLTKHLRPALGLAGRFESVSPEKTSAQIKRDTPTFEFSSLITYHECCHRYWLRHVCGFQPPRAAALGFGKLLHHLVADLARKAMRGESVSEADVDALIARDFYLPFAGNVPRARLRDAARRRVKAYLRHYGDELTRVVQPEAPFEVPLADCRIRGRIDLLLRAQGESTSRVELVDFKTASNRPPSEIHKNQLRLYALAAQRLGLTPVRLAIHDLDADGGRRDQVGNEAGARDRFERQVEGWIEGIRSGRFEPAGNARPCHTCDFTAFCRHATPARL